MRRMRNLLLFCVGITLAFVACGKEDSSGAGGGQSVAGSSAGGKISYDEPVEIEYMWWTNYKLDGTDPIFQAVEKKFNMKFTSTTVPNNEYQNYSTMRIASGDIPEMFKTEVPNDQGLGVYRGLQLDGVLTNISDYMAKWDLSNLEKVYEEPSIQLLKESDGYYLVPNYLGPSNTGLYIRQDWVDQLGLEMPKTTDDFKEFLRAIVTADPDGANTTGLTVNGIPSLDSNIFPLFIGAVGDWVEYNGQWGHKIMHPGFKEGLKWCAELYRDNLLDPEFVMLNIANIQEKISSGKAAALFINGTVAWYKPMQDALAAYKPSGEINVMVPWPTGPGGAIKPTGAPFFGVTHINSAASEAEKLRSLAFLDWLNTDEATELFYYGIEGIHHNVVNGERVIDTEAKMIVTIGRDLYSFYDLINNASQFKFLTNEPLIKNLDWAKEHAIYQSVIGLSTETTMEIYPRLVDVYRRWVADFITGSKDIDSNWDAFVNEMKSVGMDEYQAEVVAYMKDK